MNIPHNVGDWVWTPSEITGLGTAYGCITLRRFRIARITVDVSGTSYHEFPDSEFRYRDVYATAREAIQDIEDRVAKQIQTARDNYWNVIPERSY